MMIACTTILESTSPSRTYLYSMASSDAPTEIRLDKFLLLLSKIYNNKIDDVSDPQLD